MSGTQHKPGCKIKLGPGNCDCGAETGTQQGAEQRQLSGVCLDCGVTTYETGPAHRCGATVPSQAA